MSEIENNIKVVKEKAKIESLKKSIQDGLLLLQKYEAEVEKRQKLKSTQKSETRKNPKKSKKKPEKVEEKTKP